jgi:hypothetical protein
MKREKKKRNPTLEGYHLVPNSSGIILDSSLYKTFIALSDKEMMEFAEKEIEEWSSFLYELHQRAKNKGKKESKKVK